VDQIAQPDDVTAQGLARSRPTLVAIALGWVITVLALVILDDLMFGPAFWALARWQGPEIAAIVAFCIYFCAQIFLVRQGTRDDPHALAAFALRRLGLERPTARRRRHEEQIRARVLGGGSAILLSPVIGGVVPPMLLWHRGLEAKFVRRVSVVTAAIYAGEFSLLHGWIPGVIAR
jgi:hypothetical protein